MRVGVIGTGVMGGHHVRLLDAMPEAELIYAADIEAFPYGNWDEPMLVRRILKVAGKVIDMVRPDAFVVACNTASTVALAELRSRFDTPFVGTVPAIKPAVPSKQR